MSFLLMSLQDESFYKHKQTATGVWKLINGSEVKVVSVFIGKYLLLKSSSVFWHVSFIISLITLSLYYVDVSIHTQ